MIRVIVIALKDSLLGLLISTSLSNLKNKGDLKYLSLLVIAIMFLMGIDL